MPSDRRRLALLFPRLCYLCELQQSSIGAPGARRRAASEHHRLASRPFVQHSRALAKRQPYARPVLDCPSEQFLRLAETIAGIEQAIDFGPVLGPLLDLGEVSRVMSLSVSRHKHAKISDITCELAVVPPYPPGYRQHVDSTANRPRRGMEPTGATTRRPRANLTAQDLQRRTRIRRWRRKNGNRGSPS
jgi:hypothetical protein